MKVCVGVFLMIVLCGCATSYQRQGFSGGFSETQLDQNIFRVTFRGNGFTSSERVQDFVLLRSAELSLQSGFSHFGIADAREVTDVGMFVTPTQSMTTGSATFSGNSVYGYSTTTTTGGHAMFIRKPNATTTIVCFNGKPAGNAMVYDAKFVRSSLAKKYGIKVAKEIAP